MRAISTVLCAALIAACAVGQVGDPGSSAGGTPGSSAGTPGSNAPGGTTTVQSDCLVTAAPGHAGIHRLTNAEYDNTVHDLLFTTSTPGTSFDPTPPGLSGFSNDSEALQISDDLVSSYYTAGEALAKEVIASKGVQGGAYGNIVTCAPSAACAQSTIATLAARAYRRPVTAAEIATLMGVYGNDTDFDTGIQDAINAMLVSPKFLFVYYAGSQSQVAGATFPFDDYTLAARLSYALWQTMPDAELTQLAQAGQLHDPVTLQNQVLRMLKDPRVSGMLTSLRNDWAGLLALGSPSGTVMGLDDTVRAAMVSEVDNFLQDLVANDRSMLNVVSGTYAFVNQTLATYYGIPFPGSDPNAFVRVDSPSHRTGLVTSAAIMTATAGDVAFTHPVHRGLWLMQKITCNQPAQPPKGIPPVNFDPTQGGTPRQKLQAHVGPACIGCHTVMDTLGLGVENYDPFGKWRDAYPGTVGAVDPSGTLPDGKAFSAPLEMFSDIAGDDGTKACLAQQVMGYILTRALSSSDDRCVTNALGVSNVTPTGTFSGLVTKIVQSREFLMQTGEAP